MIEMSAPSRANITATARPIPESPPEMRATFPLSFPEPAYNGALYCGRGWTFVSRPGDSCRCFGIGDIGRDFSRFCSAVRALDLFGAIWLSLLTVDVRERVCKFRAGRDGFDAGSKVEAQGLALYKPKQGAESVAVGSYQAFIPAEDAADIGISRLPRVPDESG